MKKAKLSLGLIAVLAGGLAMTACDVTAKYGVILEFTTTNPETGEKVTVDYTVADLFDSYSYDSSAATSSFDSVYESLIRHYYEEAGTPTQLSEIARRAENEVNSLKQQANNNANSNGTSYASEWESILDEYGCENVDDLYAYEEYQIMKDLFETDYYDDNLEAIRDGGDEQLSVDGEVTSTGRKVFASLDDPTVADWDGYLEEKVPYHVSHILAQVDGDTSIDQCEISEADAKQIYRIVSELGAGTEFETIAYNTSINDDTSASDYGDLGIMDKDTEYVPEFKLGTYAFDALYNKETTLGGTSYRDTIAEKVLPDSDTTYGNTEETVRSFFTEKGIGVMPYGAAIALFNSSEITDYNGVPVNGGDATFYPRNILFNKYFNHRNVCVIVPTDVPYNVFSGEDYEQFTNNEVGTIDASKGITGLNDVGITDATVASLGNGGVTSTSSSAYEALPGFKHDTTDIIDFTEYSDTRSTLVISDDSSKSMNCLTDTKGRIILAVRAASDSYNGIHFIAVNRSGLNEYADTDDQALTETDYTAQSETANVTSLSEYYTLNYEGQSGYPTYTADGTSEYKTTYNNYIHKQTSDLISRADALKTTIRTSNSNISTYIYSSLLAGSGTSSDGITFTEAGAKYGDLISRYIETQREDDATDDAKNFNDDWSDYAEALTYADEHREIGDDTGLGYLISEVVAIGYETAAAASNQAGTIFAEGGAGYAE